MKKPFPKHKKLVKRVGKQPVKQEPEGIRMNRFIAAAGVCARREADKLIEEGKIRLNGKVVTEFGIRVMPSDEVTYQGKKLRTEELKYVLLNKPKGFITTMKDPQERKTVMTLVGKSCKERIFPVGRLDRETTGLLLFTNDGELSKKLTHPSHKVKKIYQVELDKPITKADFDAILGGIELEDGLAPVNELALLGEDLRHLGIEIQIGRNRIVRRIFEHFGYKVMKLDRVMFGNLTKKNLPRGKYRHLNPKEVQLLKRVK